MFNKGLLIGAIGLLLVGCGSEPEAVTADPVETTAPVTSTPDTVVAIETAPLVTEAKEDKPTVFWYQDDFSEAVENIGVYDAQAIIDSARLKPVEVEDVVDPEGEPEKIFLFNADSPLSAQFDHSPNYIKLTWYQAKDEPSAIEASQQSLKDIYKLARAIAGREGMDAVMYISNGGKYRSKPVDGYPTTGQCNDFICFFTMDLR